MVPILGQTSRANRWGGRPQRHRCATLWVVETCNRGAAHDEHYHDWPGYLQVGLPDPRRQRERKGGAQAQGAPERPDRLLREAGTLHSSDGGLWRRTSLGAHSDGPWSHGEADRPRSGETLCQEGQEERCRREAYPVDSGSATCSVSHSGDHGIAETNSRWRGGARFPSFKMRFPTRRTVWRSCSSAVGPAVSSAPPAARLEVPR